MSDVLVCGLTVDAPVLAGTVHYACNRCYAVVDVAPSGQRMLKQRELEVICVVCGIEEIEAEAAKIEPLTPDQEAELVEAWRTRGGMATVHTRRLEAVPAMYLGAMAYRPLRDGRCLVAYRQVPGQTRVCLGEDRAPTYDDYWCYHDAAEAERVVHTWDGEGEAPGRWHSHGATARRRRYDEAGQLVEEWTAS